MSTVHLGILGMIRNSTCIAETCNRELTSINYGYHLLKNNFTIHQAAAMVSLG